MSGVWHWAAANKRNPTIACRPAWVPATNCAAAAQEPTGRGRAGAVSKETPGTTEKRAGRQPHRRTRPMKMPGMLRAVLTQPRPTAQTGAPKSVRRKISSPEDSPEDSPDGSPGSTGNADAPGPGSRAGSPPGGGLTGTIQQLDGSALTVTTSQGEAQVTVAGSTTIHQVVPATGEDLSAGETVRVIGQRGDDGTIEAQSIIIIPEGAANLFSAGGRRGEGQRGQRP